MKIENLNYEIYINDIVDHNIHKSILLDLISKVPAEPYETITKTDWKLPKNEHKEYLNYFYKNILPTTYTKIQKYLHSHKYRLYNGWFQQYEKGDSHCWHVHDGANYTNVYLLELPNNEFKTQLYDNVNKKVIDLDIKEGQLLTFPASILHRSKPNMGARKTIISFNSDFLFDDKLKLD
jgi:hypothetical protein